MMRLPRFLHVPVLPLSGRRTKKPAIDWQNLGLGFRKATLGILAVLMLGNGQGSFALEPVQAQQFADGLYAREMYDMAIKEYQKILGEAPTYPKLDVVLYRLGEAHLKMGKKAEAEIYYRQLAERFPRSSYYFRSQLRAAELLVQKQKYTEALKVLDQAAGQNPSADMKPGIDFYRGLCRKNLKQTDGAIASFRAVIAQEKNAYSSLAAVELARILQVKGGQDDELLKLYRIAADNPSSANLAAEVEFLTGALYYRQKKFDQSADAFHRLMTTYPDHPRATECRLSAAWSYHNTGAFNTALDLAVLTPDTVKAPSKADWLYLESSCLRQLKRHEDAVPVYNSLISQFPNSSYTPTARYELLLIAQHLKRYEDVIAQADEVAKNPALKKDVTRLKADALKALGRDEEAAAAFRSMAEQSGDKTQAAEALYVAGQTYQKLQKYDEAVAAFTEVAAKHPTYEHAARALYVAGLCRQSQQREGDAIDLWMSMVRQFPKSEWGDEALFQAGVFYLRNKQKDESTKALRRFVLLYPTSPLCREANYYLGMIAESQNKAAVGEVYYRDALKLNPPQPLKSKVQHRLALNFQKQGKSDEAAAMLSEVLNSGQDEAVSPALLIWLLRHHADGKRWALCLTASEKLTDQAQPDAVRQLAYGVRGKAYHALGEIPSAVEALKQAVAFPLKNREALEAGLLLGDLASATKDFALSETAYFDTGEAASALGQLDLQSRSVYGLGKLALAQEKLSEAARYFMSVAVLFEDDDLAPKCLFLAADAFLKDGKIKERDSALKELRTRFPDSEWAKKK